MSKKHIYFSRLVYSNTVFGSVAISFRCPFLSGIICFLLQKNISNFVEATRVKRFTTMMTLGMSRDVMCHRLWRPKCFSDSIWFKLIHFISIWTSQNLLKIRTFLSIRKRNKLFDHPSYLYKKSTFFPPNLPIQIHNTCSKHSKPFWAQRRNKHINFQLVFLLFSVNVWRLFRWEIPARVDNEGLRNDRTVRWT